MRYTILSLLFILSACEDFSPKTNKQKTITTEPYQITIRSEISDKKLQLTLPHCLYIHPEKMPPSGTASTQKVYLRMHRLAFSHPDFHIDKRCYDENQTEKVMLGTLSPYFPTDDKFSYFLNLKKELGAFHINQNSHVLLYKISPNKQAFFYQHNFPNLTYPLTVSFIPRRETEERVRNQFRYYFDIKTIIHGEFELNYTIMANDKDSKQMAEKFRQSLEKQENPLEQKEIIQYFVDNNKAVAQYFEQHSVLIHPVKE